MLRLSVVVLLLAVFLVVNEVVARGRRPPAAETSRKIAHVGSGLLVSLSCLVLDHRWYVLVGLGFAGALTVARRHRLMRSLASRSDQSAGEVLFGVGVAVAAAIAPGTGSFVQAVLVLTLADTAAFVVGRRWPVRRVLLGRSLGGALAMLVVTTLVCLPRGLGAAVLTGVVATVVELLSPRGLDNLTVPVVVAAVLTVRG